MTAFAAFPIRPRAALLAVALCLPGTGALAAATALRPAQVSPETAASAPYRDSGRLEITHGPTFYIGTASYIRRYTGLTAGHLLYDPKTGFSSHVHYQGALYIETTNEVPVSNFAVLSGYQAAATADPNSDTAFDHDMGYLIFAKPALNDEWAPWSDNQGELGGSGPFEAVGYAAETLSGDELASVKHETPYFQQLPPAFYGNTAYYTEGGMSGGPVYVTLPDGTRTMAAINVAGTRYAEAAFSGARAITPAETPLLLNAEYDYGLITGGVIKGPPTVAAGTTLKIKTGLVFVDGPQIATPVYAKYDGDFELVASSPSTKGLVVTKVKPGRYNIAVPAGLPNGALITLKLLRTALPHKRQYPFQTLNVTVE